jgi:hypothetical protein
MAAIDLPMMQKSEASTGQIRTDTHFCWILLLCDDLSIAPLCNTESILATPIYLFLLMIRTETTTRSLGLFTLLLEFLGDEVGAGSFDQVPFFFFSACAPGSASPPWQPFSSS